MPSKSRRCVHKLTAGTVNSRKRWWGAALGLDWFGIAQPRQSFFSTLDWKRKFKSVFVGWWCQTRQPSRTVGNSSCGRRHSSLISGWISPVIIFPPEWLGQLFWTLLLWFCLVSEAHRIFTICIFTRWFYVGVDTTFRTWNLARFTWRPMVVVQNCVSSAAALTPSNGELSTSKRNKGDEESVHWLCLYKHLASLLHRPLSHHCLICWSFRFSCPFLPPEW